MRKLHIPNAILDIGFPKDLRALKFHVSMTDHLRNQVPYHSQPSAPFQATKTALLKQAPGADGNACKALTRKTTFFWMIHCSDGPSALFKRSSSGHTSSGTSTRLVRTTTTWTSILNSKSLAMIPTAPTFASFGLQAGKDWQNRCFVSRPFDYFLILKPWQCFHQ
jgi:hypothetical protein